MVRPRLAATAFVLVVAGCATQRMTATELAGRASAAPIAAQNELTGHRLVVEGVVRGATLSERESLVGYRSFATITAETHRETLGLVVLEPGSVLCYFEPDQLAQAADLKEGQKVQLSCWVDSFRPANSSAGVEAVLTSCERTSP
jgi:hypothetical protein